jgi:(R,R)-butanediol dehydrogenase/meso-butanediol dehydrogenase/diacetyl reductase
VKAVRYVGRERVEVADVDPVPPEPTDVVIRVSHVGLCGTDLHIVHGSMDARVATPLTFGHEMSGTIESLGSEVDGWSAGDRVSVIPLVSDGICPACRAGHGHVCHRLRFMGIDSAGALQELWTVPAETLIRIPDAVSLRDAALLEPLAVAVHDVRRGGVGVGDDVMVLGAGPIGTLIALVARHAGAHVTLVEPDQGRRAAALDHGFAVLDPAVADVAELTARRTEGSGADVVFEVSGAASAVLAATTYARVRGTVVIVAIHATPREVDLQRVFWRELTLVGARVYERRDFATAVNLLESGAVDVAPLISEVCAPEDVGEALAALDSGRAVKVLVDVGGHGS